MSRDWCYWALPLLTHPPPTQSPPPPQCSIHASLIWVSNGSYNSLSPIRRQAIIETSAGLLSTGTLGTNFREIWIKTSKVWIDKNAAFENANELNLSQWTTMVNTRFWIIVKAFTCIIYASKRSFQLHMLCWSSDDVERLTGKLYIFS